MWLEHHSYSQHKARGGKKTVEHHTIPHHAVVHIASITKLPLQLTMAVPTSAMCCVAMVAVLVLALLPSHKNQLAYAQITFGNHHSCDPGSRLPCAASLTPLLPASPALFPHRLDSRLLFVQSRANSLCHWLLSRTSRWNHGLWVSRSHTTATAETITSHSHTRTPCSRQPPSQVNFGHAGMFPHQIATTTTGTLSLTVQGALLVATSNRSTTFVNQEDGTT